MKKYILLISIVFSFCKVRAQETIERKDKLTESIVEVFNVLKSDKQTKQGKYIALYHRKTALALGNYDKGKRTGMWHFYDTNEKLVELFDYDRIAIAYEEPIDSLTRTKIYYAFDNKFKDSDLVTKPIKIGGRCFGYLPYLKLYILPESLYGIDLEHSFAVLEVLVSPGGRLADIKIHIVTPDNEFVTSFSPELINEDDKIFLPATLNKEPILSRIFVRCRISDFGTLDVE